MARTIRDDDGDEATVEADLDMGTVDLDFCGILWSGKKLQALELADAIREAAESLPDPPPDPWELLDAAPTIGSPPGYHGEWRRRVNEALQWHRENEADE